MDEISDELETWPILMIYLTTTDCWKRASVWLCNQHNTFSFDQIFQKFADKVDMDGISDEFVIWPDRIISNSLDC